VDLEHHLDWVVMVLRVLRVVLVVVEVGLEEMVVLEGMEHRQHHFLEEAVEVLEMLAQE